MKTLILAIIIFPVVLLNYSSVKASTLYTVPVEVIQGKVFPTWPESVEGKGRVEFLEAVQVFKDGNFNGASEKFYYVKEKYSGTKAAEIAGLYIGSIKLWNATLNEKRDNKLLMEALQSFQSSLTSSIESKNVPGILNEIGKVYLEMGRIEEAEGSLKRVIKDYPYSRFAGKAQYLIAKSYEMNGKYKEAINGYNMIMKEYPEYLEKEGFFGLGRVFITMREFGESKKIYDEGLRRWPSYVKATSEVLFNYSESQFQNGFLSEAREGFLVYYNIFPNTKKSGSALNRVADTYVLEHKAIMAEKIYRAALDIFPDGEDAVRSRLAIGDLKFMFATGQKSYDKAIEYYKEVEESSGNSPMAKKAKYKIGKVFEAQGRFNEAIGIYSGLLSNTPEDPENSEVSSSLSGIKERLGSKVKEKIKRGDYIGAVKDYQNYFKHIIDSVSDEGLLMEIADTNRNLNLNSEAAFIYQKLVDRKGEKHGLALFKTGELCYTTGDYSKAVETLGRYVADFPNGENGTYAQVMIGESFYNLKEYDKAANYFYSVLRDAPYRYSSAYIKLSDILSKSGQYEESVNILKDMLKHPQKGKDDGFKQTAYITLGNAYYGLGRYQDALDSYRIVLNDKLQKDDADTVQFLVADCLLRQNKRDEAKRIFSKLSEHSSGLIKKVSEERMKDIASGFSL